MQEYYSILRLSKDDITQVYEDNDELTPEIKKKINQLNDTQMKYLANMLGEAYCETDYWTTLRLGFEGLGD